MLTKLSSIEQWLFSKSNLTMVQLMQIHDKYVPLIESEN